MLFRMLTVFRTFTLVLYISAFRRKCAVPSGAVFCNSLISCCSSIIVIIKILKIIKKLQTKSRKETTKPSEKDS